ncbi:guanine deaminase [Pseudaminobacter soli (ex Li et al. 2025)]|uniref:Guanine deaminase n=1 Tax=Pseudaminobacter soli (ex Li et al. 2025) TaxID=1295366 RepID=A0A2P7SI30_9HYPH|nr:guanine deaminase [Mesorhizobium soli]PSJ62127.1 guanine deaminase [Mesorhizobium soli]
MICGTAFHTPVRGKLEILEGVLISVDGAGRIAEIISPQNPDFAEAKTRAEAEGRLLELPANQVLLPGLVDLHIHAPQWPQLGKALDVPLEVWLQKYTFPLEARYSDLGFAREIYADLVAGLLANGTTTAVYFATIHMEASLALAQTCLEKGQRAFVGKVAMDDPDQCPDFYRDKDAATALDEMRRFIDAVRELSPANDPLVRPVITPRFIPSCTDELLQGLGKLAAETGCLIQTHCSESDWEKDFVKARFGKTDTEVLADFGLLREHTILAHSNFVTDGDLDLIRERGAAVAHCPLSNIYFANAVFPLRAALDRNVRVGLGSDISGGHSPSILDGCRHTLMAARARQGGVDPALSPADRGVAHSQITVAEAFWLATAGGGEALGLKVGKFEPGHQFDALLIDQDAPGSNIRTWPELDSPEDVFQKIVLNAMRANIKRIWVSGDYVGRSD